MRRCCGRGSLTAAVAIPALWLIVCYLPPALLRGLHRRRRRGRAVRVLRDGVRRTTPRERVAGIGVGHPGRRAASSRAARVLGAGLAVAVVVGLRPRRSSRTTTSPARMQRLGLSLLGVLYVGFFTPHIVLLRELRRRRAGAGSSSPCSRPWAPTRAATSRAARSAATSWRPTVSPSKTVEGRIGAVAGAMLIAWLC